MPFHGLKSDLELAALIVSAGVVSFLVSGRVFSNVLFTFLLGSLFFLVGIHLDLRIFKALREKRKQLVLALFTVYGLTPLVAYIFSYLPGHLGQAFLVIGVSGAALGSPKIWSNIAKADGDLASYTATFSLLLAPLIVPLLLFVLPLEINYSMMIENVVFAAVPFLGGVLVQRYENSLLQDFRMHFSKLAFWLIVLITFVQFKLILQAEGMIYASQLLIAAVFFAAFMLLSFGYSHALSVLTGLYEKEARSIGFISTSKNIALAFFIAAHVSAEAVLLVGVYYFVRQFMGVLFTDMYVHDEPKFLERIGF